VEKLGAAFHISSLHLFLEPHKEGPNHDLHFLIILEKGLDKNTSVQQIRNVFPEIAIQLHVQGIKASD